MSFAALGLLAVYEKRDRRVVAAGFLYVNRLLASVRLGTGLRSRSQVFSPKVMFPRRALALCPKEAALCASGNDGGVVAVVVACDCDLCADLAAIVLPFDSTGSGGHSAEICRASACRGDASHLQCFFVRG